MISRIRLSINLFRVHPRRLIIYFALLGLVLAIGHLVGRNGYHLSFSKREINTRVELVSTTEKRLERNSEMRLVETRVDETFNAMPPIRRSTHVARNNVKVKMKNMTLVSEMNTTNHIWPYPETKITLKECQEIDFYKLGPLPDATVIISFHNQETLISLLRTVHSILQRSPPSLLKQIILIDDNTKKADFKKVLPRYLDKTFGDKVSLQQSNESLGLIKARILGINLADTDVVICLDSHMEVQPGWLEPLLYEIKKDSQTLAAGCLDWIEKKGGVWEYKHGGSTWKTYFDWSLVFGFQQISRRDMESRKLTDPIRSPVTVGGMFAINKKFFLEIGAYDKNMDKWGGENLDMPIRVWRCGGRVLNVPCSRAAHLEYIGSRDYRQGWESIVHYNYKRVAEVLMGDYKSYFYQYYPELKNLNVGDLSERRSTIQKCQHDFTWFLTNVFPELGLPERDGFAWGGVLNQGTNTCLDSMYAVNPSLYYCDQPVQRQGFYWNFKLELRLPMHIYHMTMQPIDGSSPTTYKSVLVQREYISLYNVTQSDTWIHWKSGPILEPQFGLCAEGLADGSVEMRECDLSNLNQSWLFTHYTDRYDRMIANKSPQDKGLLKLILNFKSKLRRKIRKHS